MNAYVRILTGLIFSTYAALAVASSAPPPAAEGAAPASPTLQRAPGGYVHMWKKFPGLAGKSIFSEEQVQIRAEPGYATVVVFVASWCERCQRLIGGFEAMREKYKGLPVNVVYVFSHDTISDAQGFAKEYKLKGQALLSNHDILKAFHNPPLPSIYIGDRHGWLFERFLDSDVKEIEETKRLLTMLTKI